MTGQLRFMSIGKVAPSHSEWRLHQVFEHRQVHISICLGRCAVVNSLAVPLRRSCVAPLRRSSRPGGEGRRSDLRQLGQPAAGACAVRAKSAGKVMLRLHPRHDGCTGWQHVRTALRTLQRPADKAWPPRHSIPRTSCPAALHRRIHSTSHHAQQHSAHLRQQGVSEVVSGEVERAGPQPPQLQLCHEPLQARPRCLRALQNDSG